MNMPASYVAPHVASRVASHLAPRAGLLHGGHRGHVRLGPNAEHLAGMLASYEHNLRTAIRWVHGSWLTRALGLGEAGNFPAALKTVAEWFPRRERAFATGIFNSGSNVGAM